MKDADGCETCQCKLRSNALCPSIGSDCHCDYGSYLNADGCETCSCLPDPKNTSRLVKMIFPSKNIWMIFFLCLVKHVGNYRIKLIFIICLDRYVDQMDHFMVDNVIDQHRHVGV